MYLSCKNNVFSINITSVCPDGFTPHGKYGELDLENHGTDGGSTLQSIDSCIEASDSGNCVAFEYERANGRCNTHLELERKNLENKASWIACIKIGKTNSLFCVISYKSYSIYFLLVFVLKLHM